MVCGLGTAIALGAALYAGAVRIDIGAFLRWSGLFLVVVAAGIVAYGLGDLQEASVLPGWGNRAYDLSHLVPTSGAGLVPYTLAVAIVNLNLMPTWLQVAGWLAYLVVVLPLFLRVTRRRPRQAGADTTVPDLSPATTAGDPVHSDPKVTTP